jgi:hypothetical protein
MITISSKNKGCAAMISRARVCPAVQQKGHYSGVASTRCIHQRVPAKIISSIDDSSKIKEAPNEFKAAATARLMQQSVSIHTCSVHMALVLPTCLQYCLGLPFSGID